MAVRISYCPYYLRFKEPFGTAHGVRTGTEALFIRVKENGYMGYGETTLPPYLKETVVMAIEGLHAITGLGMAAEDLLSTLEADNALLNDRPGCRAGLHTAMVDLLAARRNITVRSFMGIKGTSVPVTLMTVGICPTAECGPRITQLPMSGALKVKVGDAEAHSRIQVIKALDNRPLFLDGNQGSQGVDEAVALASSVGGECLIGFEQPFSTDMDPENGALARQAGVTVFADESIQSLADLDTRHAHFGGVNIKLMKCGGLDRARTLAAAGRAHGLRIMLGSMSESSLGCTAMAQLVAEADIVDLDGPWLISNDPFQGIGMANGRLVLPDGPGLGVRLTAPLEFRSIGP